METVTLNSKEQKRLLVLNRINEGKLSGEEGAELLDRSVRHVRRMLAAFREHGASALAHGNRGRPSSHRIEKGQRSRIVSLARSRYAGVNQQHFTELLAEREQLVVSRSTVRRVLKAAGIGSPRQHRRRRHHRLRRQRYPQEGMLVQIDGSRHDWFEGRGSKMTLLTAIDDATGKILGAVFRDQEDSQGYFLLLRQLVEGYGRPLAIYRDRHSIFQDNRKKLTLEEQLQGRPESTQLGRLLDELQIRSIQAWSPQAKGRVERLFGTLQDRLVTELRLNAVSTSEQAQQALADFLPRFNRRFAVQAPQSGTAWRKLPRCMDLDSLFCFKFHRQVSADNCVRLGEARIQIEPDSHRRSYARARVQVHIRMDGQVDVFHNHRCLATRPAPAEAPVLRLERLQSPALPASSLKKPASTKKQPSPLKPPRAPAAYRHHPAGHPWRRSYKGMKNEPLFPAPDIFAEHLP